MKKDKQIKVPVCSFYLHKFFVVIKKSTPPDDDNDYYTLLKTLVASKLGSKN